MVTVRNAKNSCQLKGSRATRTCTGAYLAKPNMNWKTRRHPQRNLQATGTGTNDNEGGGSSLIERIDKCNIPSTHKSAPNSAAFLLWSLIGCWLTAIAAYLIPRNMKDGALVVVGVTFMPLASFKFSEAGCDLFTYSLSRVC